MTNLKQKKNVSATTDEDLLEAPEIPAAKKNKWTNRERVLILSSRGITYRDRHLMNDLKALMPHSKTESKVDKKEKNVFLNEVAEMRNCSKCVFFEARKKQDLYVWFANVQGGPSAKFLVQNIHTSGELKLSGNCLKSSRPILSFDRVFDQTPQNQLLKELFTQVFTTPNYHPKSQPFVDHVLNFSIEDKRIWFRNYQIVDESTGKLEEIGPRMVLQLIKIFEGSFGGPVLFENPDYICPNTLRREHRFSSANKYIGKVNAKIHLHERREKEPETFKSDPVFDAVYGNNTAAVEQAGDKNATSSSTVLKDMSEAGRLKRKIDSVHKRKKKKKAKMT